MTVTISRKWWSVPALVLCSLLHAVSYAQSGKVYRIGFLETASATVIRADLEALLKGLREAGYIEGKNLIIDYRSADGHLERFPALARELVRAKPDVIVARGTPAAIAAKNAGSIPIVMAAAANPVGTGIVANLSRPGGNVTGLTSLVTEVNGKRMQLIKQLLPGVTEVGAIMNPDNANTKTAVREVENAARRLGLKVHVFEARDEAGLTRAFEEARKRSTGVMLINAEGLMVANRKLIVDSAAKRRIPTMYPSREFVDIGGLVSYGVSYPDLYYRAASYVDKILKGAKPGDLPIEQPTKLDLVINLKAAKALGVSIPEAMVLRADEVIR